jgi:hypothetical protein
MTGRLAALAAQYVRRTRVDPLQMLTIRPDRVAGWLAGSQVAGGGPHARVLFDVPAGSLVVTVFAAPHPATSRSAPATIGTRAILDTAIEGTAGSPSASAGLRKVPIGAGLWLGPLYACDSSIAGSRTSPAPQEVGGRGSDETQRITDQTDQHDHGGDTRARRITDAV